MKHVALATALCCLSVLSIAQSEPAKFGEVSMAELKMKNFASDTSVAAMILFEKGQSIMSRGYVTITYKRHVRIKIFKRDAFAEWANNSLVVERGRFSKLKGATYNLENGAVVESPLEDESVFKQRVNKYLDEIKFTLPNVKEGSVIEFSYVIDADALSGWQFQHSIPTAWSEYTADIPAEINYRKQFKGTIRPTKQETKGSESKWIFKDVPAFKSEPLMPNEDDYISQINFTFSTRTWMGISSGLWSDENFGRTVEGFPFLRKKVEELLTGITDTREKIKILTNYVKQNVEWNGVTDIYADDPKTILKNKKGTAADINLLLASMLEKADIPIELVLLSTRGNGFVHIDLPTIRQFNYVICLAHVDTVSILVDATEKYLPWDVLPTRCLNGAGFVVSEDLPTFFTVSSNTKEKTAVQAELALNEAGEMNGKLTYSRDGYAGHEMRTALNEKGQESYIKDYVANHVFTVSKSEFRNIDDLAKPATEIHEIAVTDQGTVAGDMIYVNPFVAFNVDENPFKPETREFPIDFGTPSENLYLCTITIPEGYTVDALPEPRVMSLPNKAGRYYYQVKQMGNKISVVSNLLINERVFMQDQYPNLRELYSRVVATQSEQIVLKKK